MEEGKEPEIQPQFVRTRGIFHEVWEVVKVLLISLAIVVPIRYFIAQPFIVNGASMEPNFEHKEYLIVDEVSYYFRDPVRGEPIIFRYPRDPKQFFIKRIIGLPGETIKIDNGRVLIIEDEYPEGRALDEAYLDETRVATGPNMTITLAATEYFMLGDNRGFSSDSRIWGPLEEDLIIGRAVLRAWPLTKFGAIPDHTFEF